MVVNKLKTKEKQFESSVFNDPSLMVTTCGTVGEIQDVVPVGSSDGALPSTSTGESRLFGLEHSFTVSLIFAPFSTSQHCTH